MDNRFYKSVPHRPQAAAPSPSGGPRAKAGLALRIRPPSPSESSRSPRSRSSVRERPRLGATWLATPLAAFAVVALAQPAPSAGRERRCVGRRERRPASRDAGAGIELRRADALQPPPRGDAARQLPIILRAREVRGRPDLDAVAEGDVEFRRGGIVIRADQLSYDQAEDLARATGHVVVDARRQRLQRPRAAAQGRALRGLLPHPDLPLRAHRRRRQGRRDRVHRRPARRRQRRDLLELHRRGRPTASRSGS